MAEATFWESSPLFLAEDENDLRASESFGVLARGAAFEALLASPLTKDGSEVFAEGSDAA